MPLTERPGAPFLWGHDYIALPNDEEPYIIHRLLPTSGLVNVYGKPKTAKSFAAIGMAIAISSGAPEWNSFKIDRHGPVAILQLDTPRYEWKGRFDKIAAAGYDLRNIAVMDKDIAPYPFNIMRPQHQAWLKLQLESIKPIMLIVDTLREAHDGDENDSKEMKIVVNAIASTALPAAVMFISHSRKSSEASATGPGSDLMDEARGSGYVSGRMDTIIRFTGKDEKGTMHYKGRSIGEGKLSIVQEGPKNGFPDDTGLVYLEGSREKQDLAVLNMVRDHGPTSKEPWSVNKMADALVENQALGSNPTARRRINALLNRKAA